MKAKNYMWEVRDESLIRLATLISIQLIVLKFTGTFSS